MTLSNSRKIQRALISVSDKTGLADFAAGLAAAGVEILASGGTRKFLEQVGVPVVEVAHYTGFPEMMDGRLKTLHPRIHGGILCRRDRPTDMVAAEEHGILPIDLVVVNLYPFAKTIAKPDVDFDEAIENIDIGGPTLIRAAAKNHTFVAVCCDSSEYPRILAAIRDGGTTLELRRSLAKAAFAHTAQYDAAISEWFETGSISPGARHTIGQHQLGQHQLSDQVSIRLTFDAELRYGENPHQAAALFAKDAGAENSLVRARRLHGKELSYNNFLDLDSALSVVRSLPVPGVAVLKHNNPCGAATGATVGAAIRRAWEGDPLSAFGSVLGFNAPVDAAAAEYLAEPGRFVEAIIAPEFSAEAYHILTTKPKWKDNVRLLAIGHIEPGRGALEFRQISGGMLCQAADDLPDDEYEWKVVTETQPHESQLVDLRFAWAVCRHVKSNAIVLAKEQSLIGVGAGQMSRVDSVEIAIKKAGARAPGSVLASDAFFPFDDSIHRAADAGVAAIIQPGGSRGDDAVIAACNQHGLPMVFTGRRHFRH